MSNHRHNRLNELYEAIRISNIDYVRNYIQNGYSIDDIVHYIYTNTHSFDLNNIFSPI